MQINSIFCEAQRGITRYYEIMCHMKFFTFKSETTTELKISLYGTKGGM